MKLTSEHIESQIAAARFMSRDTYERLGTLTLCILEMKNGIQVVGQSACLDPATFDAETGKERARQDAVGKVWQLEGYQAASLRRLVLPDGDVATSVQDAYDAGRYYGFKGGWFEAKAAGLEPVATGGRVTLEPLDQDKSFSLQDCEETTLAWPGLKWLLPESDLANKGFSRQQLIKDDLTSQVEHGYITPAQAVQSAVTQAYGAGYAAAKREGPP